MIVTYLNSHELIRRQIIHLNNIGFNDFKDIEFILVDDGSDPPITVENCPLERFSILYTNDKRPWTWALARNAAAKIAKGEWLWMMDGDYFLTREAVEVVNNFGGDRLSFRRKFGILDENGILHTDKKLMKQYGVLDHYLQSEFISPHTNQFVMRKRIFWELGGYNTKLTFAREYPQGEDGDFKRKWNEYINAGKGSNPIVDIRPTVYVLPTGQFCGDVDADPCNLMHSLSRKTRNNPWVRILKQQQKD